MNGGRRVPFRAGLDGLSHSTLRPRLAALLRRLGIQSLLDLGCGDFNWMRLVDLASVEYLGGDIVPALIQHNVRRYGAAGRRFVVMDMLRDSLPKVDLILCREGLVHFSFSDIEPNAT
jgi:hypothetical protein